MTPRLTLVAACLGLALATTACADAPTITEGTITFDPVPESVTDATLFIIVLDNSEGQAEEIQRLERTIDREVDGVRYELTGDEPPEGDYALRVHLDLDDDAEITTGDYLSEDVPVFLGEYPETVDVTITPVE